MLPAPDAGTSWMVTVLNQSVSNLRLEDRETLADRGDGFVHSMVVG